MIIMMKDEFEKLVGKTVTVEEYEVVEKVYMFFPVEPSSNGKKIYADMYKYFGLRVFEDMLMRSEKAQELEDVIANAKSKLSNL